MSLLIDYVENLIRKKKPKQIVIHNTPSTKPGLLLLIYIKWKKLIWFASRYRSISQSRDDREVSTEILKPTN